MNQWAGGMRWSETEHGWLGLFKSLADGRVQCRYEMAFHDLSPEAAAVLVRGQLKEWGIHALSYVAANPELWPKDGEIGESIAETFSRSGLPMMRGSKDRINRWSRVRSWLDVRTWKRSDGSEFQSPSLVIHPDCSRLIRTLPTLIADSSNPDDVEETPDEYPAAGVSYYAMSRPLPFSMAEPELPPEAVGHLVNELRHDAEMA